MPDSRLAPPPAPRSVAVPAAAPANRPIDALPSEAGAMGEQGPPRFGAALACGAAVAAVGAAAWAAVTFATDLQIGWMAVGIGAGVGVAMRRAGRGAGARLRVPAAALALFGCLAGNLLATVAYVSGFTHVPYFEVLGALDAAATADLMKATFSPMDLLFYGIAVMEAFKFAFDRVDSPPRPSVAS
jgi:hypothetical protein